MPDTELAVRILRTSEISAPAKQQFCSLFETVFEKPFPIDLFERKYRSVPQGDSFHALLLRGDEVLGAYNAIPVQYRAGQQVVDAALPADLMIHPSLRPALKEVGEMMDGLYEALRETGAAFVVVLLREQIFVLHQWLGHMEKIGRMAYYVAPGRRSLPGRAVLPWLSKSRVARGRNTSDVLFERRRDKNRYTLFPIEYRSLALSNGAAVYVRKPYFPIGDIPSFVKVAFLLDVPSPVHDSLDEVAERIAEREPDLHAIFYLGFSGMPCRHFRELKPKYQKPEWCAAIKILRPELADPALVCDAAKWNLSLGDSDLL